MFFDIGGVIQQSLRNIGNIDPSELNSGDDNRLTTMATSGLLLVEQASTDGLDAGDPLSVNTGGLASKAPSIKGNGAIGLRSAYARINGALPEVRSVLEIGKKNYVLVSFP